MYESLSLLAKLARQQDQLGHGLLDAEGDRFFVGYLRASSSPPNGSSTTSKGMVEPSTTAPKPTSTPGSPSNATPGSGSRGGSSTTAT